MAARITVMNTAARQQVLPRAGVVVLIGGRQPSRSCDFDPSAISSKQQLYGQRRGKGAGLSRNRLSLQA